ncbi:MAG: NADH-quinone oxidoreductase subunit M [Bryobacterales bacterium]|nr:NADH-quinone oxidoreductase subunit M [Bryobacterales bacterium]
MTLLTAVIFLPLLAFLIILALPKENHNAIRMFSLLASLVVFVVSLGLIGPVLSAVPGKFAFETNQLWIQSPAINYHIGMDGISLWLVMLSTLLTPLCVLVSWRSINQHIKQFFAFLLLLEFGLIGVFCALDFFLFFVFWEVSLVPMYFLIGIWGHDRRIYSAVKFFLYTMAGSALMLIAMIYLYNLTGTFDYSRILAGLQSGSIALSGPEQLWLFLGFFIAFAVKVPLFPLHTWLPDAHVEAPTAGSVMLASVMLKMGTYGLLRFCVPLFPNAARECAGWIVVLAIIGIVYGALVAMVQPNMKKLVAYSSVSHLGFVVLGIFSFTQQGFDGAVYQMLAHGISTGALFLLVGFLYERRHSLDIAAYGGVSTPAPWLSTAFMITMLASLGLPMLSNFIGEYLVLQGSSLVYFGWTVFGALGVIFAACYLLWLYQRVFFGKTSEDLAHHMPDLNLREFAIIVPLIVLMVWMGTYTQSFLPPISASNAVLLGPLDARREIHVKNTPPHPPASGELANAR